MIGCSILYHLTKLGWGDVVLLERDELTSGSTWHAAANIHGLHDHTNITRIQNYTMDLYNALEAETGQSCGVFQPGSLYLAQTGAREHQLRLQAAKARYYYFCCNGIIPGFSQSGGMGLMAAQWMVEGESQYDMGAAPLERRRAVDHAALGSSRLA